VHAALDPALLRDDELAAGPAAWRSLPDPLPTWQVAADGYVHDHDHDRPGELPQEHRVADVRDHAPA
jgi:hypothetical protein